MGMSYLQSSSARCALLTILLFATIMLGCSMDEPTAPTVPNVQPIYARDFIHFTDTSIVLQVAIRCQPGGFWEPFLEDEAVIGEPYTDVNGNGRYDNGVDTFVRSSDPSINQDLNYNGRHDGPENIFYYNWDSSVPWDDLDGNGTMRIPTGNMVPDQDCQYAPFIDWNGNGRWDSAVAVAEQLFQYREEFWNLEEMHRFSLSNVYDSMAYQFISDSGISYWMDSHNWPTRPEYVFHCWQESTAVLVGTNLRFFLADTSRMASDTGTTVRVDNGPTVPYFATRHITLDTTLQLDDTLFQNLLYMRFDSVHNAYFPVPDYVGAYWEFFFDREVGLLAYRMTSYPSREPITFYLHRPWTGTFPLPLTKVDRPR